jgi:hypothetical protein
MEVCPFCSFELGRPSKRRTKLKSTLEEFRNCALTPREYHSQYVDEWENFSSNNLFIVNYDLLLSEFEEEMLRIAERVGSDKVSFTNLLSPLSPDGSEKAPAEYGQRRQALSGTPVNFTWSETGPSLT